MPTVSGWEAGQGDSAAPSNGVEGIWTLVFGGSRKVVAPETAESLLSFMLTSHRCLCGQGEGVVPHRGTKDVPFGSFHLFLLYF